MGGVDIVAHPGTEGLVTCRNIVHFTHWHYAAAVGTESVPAVDDGNFAVHDCTVKPDARTGTKAI